MDLNIHSISADSPLLSAARKLFTAYAGFLGTLPSHACSIAHFDREIETLPAPYTASGGELLLALIGSDPAASIAYRSAESDLDPDSAEIKRLFVAPAFRSQGLARTLIAETLTRIAARGYTRVILDTDLAHMPAAVALYTGFGFREYGIRKGPIALFELNLTHSISPPSK